MSREMSKGEVSKPRMPLPMVGGALEIVDTHAGLWYHKLTNFWRETAWCGRKIQKKEEMYMKKWKMRVVPLLLALVLAAGLLPVRAWAADEEGTDVEDPTTGVVEPTYQVKIQCLFGGEDIWSYSEDGYKQGDTYTVTAPAIPGYVLDDYDTKIGTIDGGNAVVTFNYSIIPPEPVAPAPDPEDPGVMAQYTLTVNHKYHSADGATTTETEIILCDTELNVLDAEYHISPKEKPYYTYTGADRALEGTITGDTTITLHYTHTPPVESEAPTELPPGEDLLPPPETIPVSPIQDAVKDEKEIVPWIERIEAPEYAGSLYEVLSGGSDPEDEEIPLYLIDDNYFTLSDGGADVPGQTVVDVEGVDFDLADLYAGGDVSLGTAAFENEDFYQVSGKGAGQVDYAKLKEGDAVKTSTFNGIFITSIPRDDRYDEAKKEAVAYVSTVFQAFDRDHPEVFWLTGKCKMRIPTVRQADGTQRAYFFLVLAEEGYTMRSPAWTEPGAVEQGIQRRDKAVTEILATVTAAAPADQVRQLNRWLTEHNQYNTTPDLTTIGNEPHECLAALEGRIDRDGPVCDGYSRAFKVLCDKLDIPCVLENGYAKTGPESEGTFHMWNAVKIDGQWYGVDVTWNDPTVKGFVGAKSGKENEQFLLVGLNTMVRGLAFGVSHPVLNKAAINGVAFNNGPSLNPVALSAMPDSPDSSALPFTDVAKGVWYYDNVAYVYGKNLMRGTTGDKFSPTGPTTRQQLWMILARIDGANPKDMNAARAWAVDSNVSDGSNPGGQLTREQLVTMLYRFCQSKGQDVSGRAPLSGFADAGDVSGYAQDALA